MLRLRACLAVPVLVGAVCAPSLAFAQTISATSQPYPDRTQALRPQNLNPQGVSYNDCVNDMTLTFHVLVSGFTGAQNLQIWASKSSDCTAQTDRGIGAAAALCWLLPGGFTAQPYSSTRQLDFALRVQDILAWQNTPPFPPVYQQGGASACTLQATFAPVPININFLPMDSTNQNTVGTAYQYTLNVDTVGPPSPTGIGESVGHTLFNVNWNVNTDTDTAGYDIFIDPIPGQEGLSEGGTLTPETSTVTVCPDTGTTQPTGDDSGDDGSTTADGDDGSLGTGDDGSTASDAGADVVDTGTSTPSDAGCYTINHGGSPTSTNGYTCNSAILASGIVQDGGATTVVITDESGVPIEGGTTTEGPGGISTIPDSYRTGGVPTVTDKSRGSYTISGLVDGVTYNVVVAAVDGYGNVGAPSSEVCDFPAPVQDFWQTYETDGGKAGGFCTLEGVGLGGTSLAGFAGIVGLAGIVRRMRRKTP